MSGKRCKRLRAEFFEQFGRFPKKTRTVGKVKKLKNGKTVGVSLGATFKDTSEQEVNGIFR